MTANKRPDAAIVALRARAGTGNADDIRRTAPDGAATLPDFDRGMRQDRATADQPAADPRHATRSDWFAADTVDLPPGSAVAFA